MAKHTDHVDILFANAGASWGASFDTTPENTFNKVMDLNVKSVFLSAQKYATDSARKACLPHSLTLNTDSHPCSAKRLLSLTHLA